jgi:hypothetical protein
MKWKSITALLLALSLVGCATTTSPKQPSDLVSFLADGKTTKAEVITTLGEPSGRFDAEKVFTYRLGHFFKRDSYRVMPRQTGYFGGWGTWDFTQFSLVLVFDDAGVLQKHSLLKVNQ